MDPLGLIDRYGTDALRFSLTTGTAPGNDLRFTESRVEAARNFANKIWNASRFVMTSVANAGETSNQSTLSGWRDLPNLSHREDRWIVSRMDRVIGEVNRSMESFELGEAQQKLYDFIWNDFCDWYIEMVKIRLRQGGVDSPLPTLVHVLERTLRAIHPFLPFITEEIWQNLRELLPGAEDLPESIMICPYPQDEGHRFDAEAEDQIGLVMRTVRAVRNTRAQLGIPVNQTLEALVEIDGFQSGLQSAIEEESQVVRALCRVDPLRVVPGGSSESDARKGVTLVVNPLVVRLPLEGVVDLSEESQRLRNEMDDCLRNLNRLETLVSNPNFRAKAQPEVVKKEEDRLAELQERRQRLEEILAQLAA